MYGDTDSLLGKCVVFCQTTAMVAMFFLVYPRLLGSSDPLVKVIAEKRKRQPLVLCAMRSGSPPLHVWWPLNSQLHRRCV